MTVSLRAAQPPDLDLIREWRNHPSIRMNMFTQHEITPAEHIAWFNSWATDPTRRVLVAEESGQPIGLVTLKNVARLSDSEWGFYVQPGSPTGTGTRMCGAALDYAFRSLGVGRVIGRVLAGNIASERLHKNLGFSSMEAPVGPQGAAGESHPARIFVLCREQWLAAHSD